MYDPLSGLLPGSADGLRKHRGSTQREEIWATFWKRTQNSTRDNRGGERADLSGADLSRYRL